ncbi:MAG: GTP-binding protein, partial [Lachnospiraceae bacterium]|nr:GTP-binding protein [Lachnospiraceae bacterium]
MEKEHRVIGILAHVDAGKTTLAEAILYTTGVLREAGRVDHQDAFLDHYAIERQRGITVFSKQALFSWKDEGGEELDFTLLDTPGHVDFSAEMERTLQVLDYAMLVVSGADGVQGHTRTLWSLLRRYEIPTFLFVNKMDQEGTDATRLLSELQNKLDEACICFSNPASVSGAAGSSFSAGSAPASNSASAFDPGLATEAFYESLSLCDEQLMEEYLETGSICDESIAQAVADRKIFPTYFGSALRLYGVKELLDGLVKYSLPLVYPAEFGARVFKISRDKQGNRLTHLKVTGGVLRAKQVIDGEDKADQLRLYNGQAHQILQEVPAGRVCAVTGLSSSQVGQGFGIERGNVRP